MLIRPIVLGAVALLLSAASVARTDEFASAMDTAMAQMHDSMMSEYTGIPDRDFAAMMIAHHQGAVDMAEIELRFGKDERLRRLAQGIIVEQRQEIAVMRGILDADQTLPSRDPPSSNKHPHPGARP